MLSVGNNLGSSGASLSLDTRVAVGAGVFAVSAAEASAAAAQTRVITTPEQKIPAYNAFEFTYRSDVGKVILLRQNVETGQQLTQVPTEYHLRQYAATQRDQRVQQQHQLYKASGGASQGQSAAQTVVVTTTAKTTGASSAPSASPPSSPSVAPSTVAAAAVAHVDIKA
jgi:hypothetical protein